MLCIYIFSLLSKFNLGRSANFNQMKNNSSDYSLIIIGAGVTGLTSGIVWALNNDVTQKPVLIIEKNRIPGGFVTSFKRDGFLFDTSQIIPDPDDIFKYLGINLDLIKFGTNYCNIYKINPNTGQKEIFKIPAGFAHFKKFLLNYAGEDFQNVNELLSHIRKMYFELNHLKVEPNFFQLLQIIKKCPLIIKNSNKTFSELLDKYNIKNEQIREILEIFAAFSGLPAKRAAALMVVGALNTSVDAAFRPKKGFIELPLSLKKRYEELGGKILFNTEVQKILIEKNKVKGIKTSDGTKIYSENVVTTIDPKIAMKKLVGAEILGKVDSRYLKKVEEIKMSPSSFTISLGLKNEFDLSRFGLASGYNVITTGNGAFEKLFQKFDKGLFEIDNSCFHIAVISPSLIIGGKPNLIIRLIPVSIGNWSDLRENDYKLYFDEKNRISNEVINLVEKYLIKDLSENIITKDIATPATYARYSGSPTGSNYDMSPYPDNFGRNRLKMRTPIKNLYQPKFSHGIWPCMQSGFQVIDMIMQGKIMKGNSRFHLE